MPRCRKMRHNGNSMARQEIHDIFNQNQEEIKEWFTAEIAGIRTGRVKPDMVERIPVEHYGVRTPLNGLASINSLDARTLGISPWDQQAAPSIEKALTEAALGALPSRDEQVIRLVFPSLTEEVRGQTLKLLHKKVEEARVRLRQARDEALKLLKEQKEAGDITEDDFYDGRGKLDDLINNANEEIERLAARKEEDIKTV